MDRTRRIAFILILLLTAVAAFAHQPTQQTDSGLLTLDQVFSYQAKGLDEVQWQADGSGYLALEPSPGKQNAVDIVRYDAGSGARSILVSADRLIPPAAAAPLLVEQFDFSQDGKKVLLFTNSQRVWRSNTRGDYWVFDLTGGKLKKLGGGAKPLTLMLAKFSPDGTRVGYVREDNIYCENLADGRVA